MMLGNHIRGRSFDFLTAGVGVLLLHAVRPGTLLWRDSASAHARYF